MNALELIQPGALVFDVGANAGEKTAQYLSRGASHVVCFEPQPAVASRLRDRFAHDDRVVVEQLALSAEVGAADLILCDESDHLATLEPRWTAGRFHAQTWQRRVRVALDTLDRMIAKYGRPEFLKIDVEGHEARVLLGLTSAVPCLSFEYVREFSPEAETCAARCAALGMTEFNVGRFDSDDLTLTEWVDLCFIPRENGGDIYARVPR